MATIQSSLHYDINRDTFMSVEQHHRMQEQQRYEYEKAMHYRRQEEEHRRMQSAYYANPIEPQTKLATPKSDSKDPLGFLSKSDSKLLLIGK